jgi:hypothetical protein
MRQKLIGILLIFCASFVLSSGLIPYLFNAPVSSQTPVESTLKSYIIPKRFSILLPRDLIPENKIANDIDYFSFTNYKYELAAGEAVPTEAIETEITFSQKNLEIILQTRLRQANQYNETVTNQGNLTIDGQEARRVWYAGGEWNFPNEISSYIPYEDNQTVVISSYYSADNPTAVDTIQRIHWSFRRLDL